MYYFVLQLLYVGAFQPQMFWHQDGPLVGVDCRWQDSKEAVLWTGEIVFTIIFLVEMIIKIIARGFFMNKHAYLRDTLNWLDFIVVVSGTISVLMDMLSLPKSSISQVFFAVLFLYSLPPACFLGFSSVTDSPHSIFALVFFICLAVSSCIASAAPFEDNDSIGWNEASDQDVDKGHWGFHKCHDAFHFWLRLVRNFRARHTESRNEGSMLFRSYQQYSQKRRTHD